ncbi:unnamed protein product [Clonostachys solani]|uniref:Glycoside hydrolase family 39 protein n=1 Tax=Clonostachys solani TaxID=160281 RepID=A0A9N9YSP9_9HYPO|nr:unnamed protein product [Clonostachys solani]
MKLVALLACVTFTQLASAAAIAPDPTLNTGDISGTVEKRASGTATVNLASLQGSPGQLGSGFIYGFPDNSDGSASGAIPSNLVNGVGLKYCRAGGSQVASPGLGYARGQLQGRLKSFQSNYNTCRKAGARYQVILAALWGSDGVQGDISWPGDNGSWTAFDDFLSQVISFIKSNNMQSGLDIDIWNEPDSTIFWNRAYSQYLSTWTRAYNRFKQDLSSVPIVGPSISVPASTSNGFWTAWLDNAKSTNTIPDFYTYHVLGLDFDVRGSQDTLKSMLSARGLAYKDVIVNEYGATAGGDQTNAGSVWYLANFERQNIKGLRAHWGMGFSNLHNGMAGLVNFEGTRYFPSAQWYVYNYYANSMTGNRVATTSSGDGMFEVFATRGSSKDSVRILTGLRPKVGVRTYDVRVTGLSALGISGSVQIRTKRFTHLDWYLEGSAPTDLGIATHTVSDDQITFWVTPDNEYTAYAFEFVS